MSYPQFGYPYSSAPQFLMTTNSLTTCCESGSRSLAEAGAGATAQTPVYCPVYESRLLATARHELTSAAALGVYGSPYSGSQGYGNYVAYGTDAPAFYSLNTFDSKDGSSSAHAGITQAAAAAYYPYDHTLSQYQYDRVRKEDKLDAYLSGPLSASKHLLTSRLYNSKGIPNPEWADSNPTNI